MKTCLFYIFTALCVMVFTFSQNAFAQGSPRSIVRVIYFLPKNRHPQPNIDTKLDTLLKQVKRFYADEMQRHGYGRKTFKLQTDRSGKTIVHRLKGKFNDAYYQRQTSYKVNKEVVEAFGSENINFVAIETRTRVLESGAGDDIDICGQGSGYTTGGMTLIPASGHCFDFEIAAHELGHAFGLDHDFRNDAYVMSYGAAGDELSVCAAEWLSVHRNFLPQPKQGNFPPTIQVLPPQTSPPDSVRFRFTVSDSEGIHQIQLLSVTAEDGLHLVGCQKFNAERSSVKFQPTVRIGKFGTVFLVKVMDVRGHFTEQHFEIDATPYLPAAENISVPDPNLATALRKALDLPPEAKITHLDMRKLSVFEGSEKPIKDLTGLEYAKNLKTFRQLKGHISDLTPLAGATDLGELMLLSCHIDDIRPLKALKNLSRLHLGENQIRDLTPLAALTNLRVLSLWDNHIDDLTPLADRVELETLWLGGNEIDNITVLKNMKHLQLLDLAGNHIQNITPLAHLSNIKRLDLRKNQIRDITALSKMRHLKQLSVAGNPIQNLQPLKKLMKQNPGMKLDIVIPQGVAAAPVFSERLPDETALLANYPNPFNPETWIPYQLAETADVTIHISAANGTLVRMLALGYQRAGDYQNRSRAAYWDGRNDVSEPVASGVYFYTLTAGDFTATRKMLIMK